MRRRPLLFTIEEANDLLPKIEGLLDKWSQGKAQSDKLHDHYFMSELLSATESGQGYQENERVQLEEEAIELDHSVERLRRDLEKIEELGCIVRSLEKGQVEFLSKRDGKLVYLCWNRGDEKIRHYRYLRDKQRELFPLER